MKTIDEAQDQTIQQHLVNALNLVQSACTILPSDVSGCSKYLERAEAELTRALQMFCALPDDAISRVGEPADG
jgi:surfactin synthase thioesterase subunit